MRFSKLFSLQNKFIFISAVNIILPLVLIVALSYTKSIELIRQQVSQSNLKTVEQVADNVSMMFQDMKNSSVYLLQNEEFMNYLRLSKNEVVKDPGHLLAAHKFINNYLAFNTNIHSIYLEAMNGLVFDSESAHNTISPRLRRELVLLRGDGVLIPDVITNYNGTQTRVFSYIKIIKDTENLASNLAILKINLPEASISKVFGSKLLSENSSFFIVDDAGSIVSSFNAPEAPPEEMIDAGALSGAGGYDSRVISDKEYVVTCCPIRFPSWKLLNLVPLHELSQDITIIRNITLLSIICSLLICMLIVLSFSIKVFSPLKKLRKAMFQLENENFDVNIDIRGHDEIALLADSFNKMSRKLDALVNEVLSVQIKQKEAELKALQMQINPHFLYNTLDMIYWRARLEKATDSAALVKTLSGLFRLTLSSGNEFTSLEKELEHLRLYITIQENRFEGAVTFNLTVEDGLMDCKVVRLILQPLVENGIVHGIERNGGQGAITVSVFKDQDALVCEIEDDGAGAEESAVTAYLDKVERNNQGFALNNVNSRIQAYYGKEYGLSFETAPGKGMKVRVTQPLIKCQGEPDGGLYVKDTSRR